MSFLKKGYLYIALNLAISLGVNSVCFSRPEVITTEELYQELFPPVENILLRAVFNREENLKNILALIKVEPNISKTLRQLPKKLTQYYRWHQKIYNKNGSIVSLPDLEGISPEVFDKSPWVLNRILSQNYTLLFSADGSSGGIEAILALLTLKKQILMDLTAIDKELKKWGPPNGNLMRYFLVPSIKATINQMTPVGAMIEFMDSIQCELADRFCMHLKSGLGSALHFAISKHQNELQAIESKFTEFTQSNGSTSVDLLKSIYNFNVWYLQSGSVTHPFSSDELRKRLIDLVEYKSSSNMSRRYEAFSQHLVLMSELTQILDRRTKYSVYKDELNSQQKLKAYSAIKLKLQNSISAMNKQIKILALSEEELGQ
ncbi:MAG: hypothetical protein J0M15_16285 [Deltaproteobacteria bacterium]|nr:hypothetical protein [Deltaproteobacteria bacterium]